MDFINFILEVEQVIKNNLGWVVALILVAGQPVLSAAPQFSLWDMYALAAVLGFSSKLGPAFNGFDRPNYVGSICNTSAEVADGMIRRRR